MSTELLRHKLTKGWEWKQKLLAGEIKAEQLVGDYLANAQNDTTNSYITVTDKAALAAAAAYDKNPRQDALAGIPLALKDIFVTKGVRTTCGSKILDNYIPPYDGTVVRKVNQSGAISVGKLNMDEFAMGSSGENSAYGWTKHPQDETRVPGGSSSGSAAAVAAGSCVMSLGTDTGGSVRQPAALTGLVGLKPTYGRVSRYGVIAFASSLDQVSPFALDVQDCADLLQVIAGYDEWDATSANKEVPDYGAAVREIREQADRRGDWLKNLRVGYCEDFFGEGLDSDVRANVEAAMEALRSAGATLTPIELPHAKYALAVYYVVAVSEASANLARYDGVRFGGRKMPDGEKTSLTNMYESTRGELFGPEVKRRILLGTFALSAGYYDAYFRKACQVRNLVGQDFQQAFQSCDVILGPTTPTVAFTHGAKSEDPLKMYLNDIYTVPVNLAGLPGMSLPWGSGADNLPVGVQLIGPAFGEASLLRTGAAMEALYDAGK